MINKEPVSIVMPMKNASTTILFTLKSLNEQKYPINEIIIINDGSTDNSLKVIEKFSNTSKLKIRIISREKSEGPGEAFNLGVKNSKSDFVVFIHADCFLATENELRKLMEPFAKNKDVVATYPTIRLSLDDWKKFTFWEKVFFAREAGRGVAGFTTKFDSVKRNVYLKLRGFDTKNFKVGGEDADLNDRLRKEGKVVLSKALVNHIHYLGGDFSFLSLLKKRRQYAAIYGRLIRIRKVRLIQNGLIFLVKPILAVLPFFPDSRYIGITLLIVYAFSYTKRMFVTRSTFRDPRIIILPFVNILFLYLETFWTLEFFLFGENRR